MTKQEIILSGIKPSGALHLGNYLGALKNFVALQDSGALNYFFIADLHSLTENADDHGRAERSLEVAADFLAAGLDPQKSVIFVQSHVPECTELAWIFDTIIPVQFLERMTQYKDKAGKQKKAVNAGLLTYPSLMAADILLYQATQVPVGEDQTQHLELTCDAARFFNKRFGEYFTLPKPLYTKAIRIMSLRNPERKMSKTEPEGCIFLSDEPEIIQAKFKKAVTTPAGLKNLQAIAAEFTEFLPADFEFNPANNAKNKELIAQAVSQALANFRAAKKELLADPEKIKKILISGAAQARIVAQKNIQEIKKIQLILLFNAKVKN
jgi:tryptophanyl-tRNA synthetase